jgi:methionine sulfoxide reductase heme-binding subunit
MAGTLRARLDRWGRHAWAKPVLGLGVTLPLGWLVWAAWADQLGANPAEALIRATGDWTLRFLCVALAVTPLRQWCHVPTLARFRRLLGLTVFAYACLHLTAYVWLDMGAAWADVVADVTKRPFIALGMAGWALLLLLALTSFNAAVRWLGGARWRALHRAVYAIAVLAVLHFWWMRAGKNNFTEVWVYATVLAVLLSARVWHFYEKKASSA